MMSASAVERSSLSEWDENDEITDDESRDERDEEEEMDQEALEVALYCQVHFEPNNECQVDYSLSSDLPQPAVMLVEEDPPQTPPTVTYSNDDATVKSVKKRPTKDKDRAKPSKKAKVVLSVESDDEKPTEKQPSTSITDFSKFLRVMSDRSLSESANSGEGSNELVMAQQQVAAADSGMTEVVEIDSDSGDVILIDGVSSDKPSVLVESSEDEEPCRNDVLLVTSSSEDDDMLYMLGNTSRNDPSPDLHINAVGVDHDATLRDILDNLPKCDWKLSSEDRLGNGSKMNGNYKRYYGAINVRCRNCNEKGHMSMDCSKPKKVVTCILCAGKGHMSRYCPKSLCHNCDQPGHSSQNCDEPRRSHRVECHRCQLNGHLHHQCPDLWRQFHITTSEGKLNQGKQKANVRKYCSNCARKGHFTHSCTRSTFNKHLPCLLPPFTTQYDDSPPRVAAYKHNPNTVSIPAGKKKKSKLKSKLGDQLNGFVRSVKKLVTGNKDQTLPNQAGKKKKRPKKNKKVKLEAASCGDFQRSVETSPAMQGHKKKTKKKKQKLEMSGSGSVFGGEGHFENVRNHINQHYNTQNAYSPWDVKSKAKETGVKKAKNYRPKKKKNSSAVKKEPNGRTVFISKKGFKVTTKIA